MKRRRWWQTLAALLLAVALLSPLPATAAEVLQVREPDLLLIGDHNRTYSVRLACITPKAGQEAEAVNFLRKQLPRRQRVNLMPMGSQDGLLLARVRPLGSELDLSTQLVEAQLASNGGECTNRKGEA